MNIIIGIILFVIVVFEILIIMRIINENYWYSKEEKFFKVLLVLFLPILGALYVYRELYKLDKTIFINKKENINSNRNRASMGYSTDNAMIYEAVAPKEEEFKEIGNYESTITIDNYNDKVSSVGGDYYSNDSFGGGYSDSGGDGGGGD